MATIGSAGNPHETPGFIAERIVRLERHTAPCATARRSISIGQDGGVCPQIKRIRRHQFNDPVLVLHRVCLNEPVLIHHFGIQRNRASIGNQVAVIIHRSRRQGHFHAHPAAIRTLAERHRLTGSQTDGATGSLDVAVIFHLVSNEKSAAAIAHLDGSIVDDARQRGRTIEFPNATAILRRRTIGSGNHQTSRADK